MKKLFTLFFLIFTSGFCIAVNPTYTLTAKNFIFISINAPDDALEFDVYISNTNGGVTNFEFAGSQLFFSFNRAVLTCPFPATGTDTSGVRYRIIGSDLPTPMQPRNPQIATATSPTADVLRLAINTFPGSGSGIDMTNNGSPGTKIVRMRLHNKLGTFANQPLNLAWRNPPIVAVATKIFAYVGTTNTDITTSATHSIDSTPAIIKDIILRNKVIPEGLYYNSFNLLGRRDTLKVYLRNVNSPYNIIDTSKAVIDSITFLNDFYFYNALSGTYYIQMKHFNSIETWSKNGGETFSNGAVTTYDFTTSASQAYGNNLKLKGSKYCIYSGDINQDGWVDIKDLAKLDNDSYNLITGSYLPSDLNGDGIVDGFDFLIGDNNWRYVRTISPLSEGLTIQNP